jgi:hypothetical protein
MREVEKLGNKKLLVYQFKVTLLDVEPPVWRRIQVANHITLSRVSAILVTVMGWNGGHLHELRIGGKFDPEEFGVKRINRALQKVYEAEALFNEF